MIWLTKQLGIKTSLPTDIEEENRSFDSHFKQWLACTTTIAVFPKDALTSLIREYLNNDLSIEKDYQSLELFFEAVAGKRNGDVPSDFLDFAFNRTADRTHTPKCAKCKSKEKTTIASFNKQALIEINLPDQKAGNETLRTLIEESIMSSFQSPCAKCGMALVKNRTLIFAKPQKAIIFNLNRTRQDPNTGRARKIERRVTLCDEIFITTPNGIATYELCAAVEHKNSLDSGHFVAHLKNDTRFWKTDDSRPIIESKMEEVERSSVFLFKRTKKNEGLFA